jgi:hypothetical protein
MPLVSTLKPRSGCRMARYDDDSKEPLIPQTGGGFEDGKLLKLLCVKTPNAKAAHHPVPDLLIEDLMCRLHQIANGIGKTQTLYLLHIYNFFMRPYRTWFAMGVKRILVQLDKGDKPPKIKSRVTVERSESRDASHVFPYKKDWRLIGTKLVRVEKRFAPGDATKSQSVVAEIQDTVRLNRLMRTRSLMNAMLSLFFSVFLRHEKLPPGCELYVDFTLDAARGPVLLTDKGWSLAPAALRNTWLEADWSMSRWLRLLPYQHALVLSVDGDMLPVLALNVTLRAQSKDPEEKKHALHPIYLYNYQTTDTSRVVYIQQFVVDLQQQRCSATDLAFLCHITGNDYVSKAEVTPGLGSASVWNAMMNCCTPLESNDRVFRHKDNTAMAFIGYVRTLYGYNKKGDQAPRPDTLIHAFNYYLTLGMKVWHDCCSSNHPETPDEF